MSTRKRTFALLVLSIITSIAFFWSVTWQSYPNKTSKIRIACISFLNEMFRVQRASLLESSVYNKSFGGQPVKGLSGHLSRMYSEVTRLGFSCNATINDFDYLIECKNSIQTADGLVIGMMEDGCILLDRGAIKSSSGRISMERNQLNSQACAQTE